MAIRIAALVLLVIGVGFLWEASRYPFGTPGAPGPGFLPVLMGIAYIILTVLMLIWPGPPITDFLPPNRAGAIRIVATIVFLGIAIALLDRLGFLVTMTFMMLGLLLVLDRRPVRDIILAPLSTAVVYVIFKVWLHVPLPTGVLSF